MSSESAVELGDPPLSCRVARLDAESWHRILDGFEDANIFQTAPFCSGRAGSQTSEHLVVTNGAHVVAAAQVRIVSVPVPRAPIAYVLAGPLFHRRGEDPDWGALRRALRALRMEYVACRKGSVRVKPLFTHDWRPECPSLFQTEAYSHVPLGEARRTMIIDLQHPLADLRKGLDQKWRNCLNRAEKNDLQISEGTDDAMFELFLRIYGEMVTRKRLVEPGNIRSFRSMQGMLPERYKTRVIVVLDKGEPSAGVIISAIGSTGILLFGATADRGMSNKASYLAHWRAVQWLKERHCAAYDLHGVNAQSNPGVYLFKRGLCGRNGKEVEVLGPFDAHHGLHNRLALAAADFANQRYKRLKSLYGKYRGFQG